ncbi:MAG TPA: AAA family ATPase [Candidatus Eisenbacteria bacterium]|nr:AAA family ATPase [Candidatus Eisenbacteria bacterium]
MAKDTISFVCQECGYDSPAYLGKCPECGNWNSFKEFHTGGLKSKSGRDSGQARMTNLENIKPQALSEVVLSPKNRILTGFAEMDMVLGGGIVLGSATLLAGDPGIGKSTVLLQLCLNLSGGKTTALKSSDPHPLPSSRQVTPLPKGEGEKGGRTVLYISAEESKEQVAMRAMRLIGNKKLPETLLLLSITDVDQIVQVLEEVKPDFAVIDSVQTVESEEAGGMAGSVSQIRYATSRFIRTAKEKNIPIFLVGHVTKEGMVAGPMVLSHMVDTVLFLEGEKYTKTRILRSFKNRFGPVDEVGIFLMDEDGLQEVKNPEQIFLSDSKQTAPGSVLTVILEGSRPFLIEIQALVVYSKFPMPRRVSSGLDNKRVELLLAVLQKHTKLPLENYDVFVNVAGGIRVTDRAVDLGVCLAIYSSLRNKPLPRTVGIAEVGLLGELRKVPDLTKRIKEAKKLGFTKVITAEIPGNLMQTLENFGYTPGKSNWKQEDERHFKIPQDEE